MGQPFRVVRAWDETHDIKCFELAPTDDAVRCVPEPGAHIDVHVAPRLVRQYSLWNGPEDTGSYFIGVKKEAGSRGGSRGMHDLAVGSVVSVGGPRNNFPLDAGPARSILMAGGIGITPLLSMARHLRAEGRPHELHLFCRSEEQVPFKALLADLGSASLHLGLEGETRDALVNALIEADKREDAHVYTCGPKPFMNLVVTAAESKGFRPGHIHLEYFSAEVPETAAGDGAIEIVLARTGRSVIVAPDQTITEALIADGVDILTSCEQGACGTCLTKVLDGEPDHRDVYLSAAEKRANTSMLPCVSRCKGPRLVLDL